MKYILLIFTLLPILGYSQATLIDKSQISASGASTNQILKWNGTAWVFANDENSGSITGTGTSGQIAFWNGTTSLTGSNNLFWDITNNRLGIGTTSPASTSILDITSTTKGILIPRMTLAQRDAITSPATGLQIYNTNSNVFQYYNGSSWTNVGGTGVTDLTFSGSSSPITLNSSTGTDVTFTAGTNVNFSQAGNNLTINSTAMANPMTTLGDVIYGGASGTPTRLAGNTIAQRKFLTQTGTGSASAAPEWYFFDESAYVNRYGESNGQVIYGGNAANTNIYLECNSTLSRGAVYLNYIGGDIRLGGGSGNPNLLKFYEKNSLPNLSDSNFVAFKAPNVLSANTTYTLPTADGTSNQVLTTNGSGTLSWTTPSTGISGTSSFIPYFNTSSTLGTTGLKWDNTNSYLGINNFSPGATLAVAGGSDAANTFSLYVTNNAGDKYINFENSGKVGINVAYPKTTLSFNGSMSRKAAVRTGVATSYTVVDTDSWIICTNTSSTVTLTLPSASDFQGREIMVRNAAAIAVNSASSNVISLTSNPGNNPPTTTTSILPATAGKWATLVSSQAADSSWYWIIMQAN